ncbi:MAG: YihY/virulence factor BrkB family protein [Pseudomonadota bacterium]
MARSDRRLTVLHMAASVWRAASGKDLSLIAAGVAFYAMLAIFPAFAAAIAIWGLVADPIFLERQLSELAPIMPDAAFSVLDDQMAALIAANESTLGWTFALSLTGALWTARAGVAALIGGLNAVTGSAGGSGALRRIGRGIVLTTTLIIMALTGLLTVLILPGILAFLPLGPLAALLASVARWGAAVVVLVLGLGLIYRYGPDHPPLRVPWISAGSLLAILLWGTGSVALTVYFRNVTALNEVYGSLGAVASLLIWFYLSAFAVLIGAQLNAILARDRAMGGSA